MYVPVTPALTAPPLTPAGLVVGMGEAPAPVPPAATCHRPHRTRRLAGERPQVSLAGTGGLRVPHRPTGHPKAHRPHRPMRRLRVYRLVEVSWYGGGGSLACGGSLTSSTMGVANKTLPCGTRVTLRYHGRTVRVRVIDRGPYVEGREYDLTEATARALGFEGVGEMWASV
jgi:rare lipoprotein A (peptidoglycan hydrolase)